MNDNDFVTLTAGISRLTLRPDIGGAVVGWSFGGTELLRPISEEAVAAKSARKLGCFPLIPYSNRIGQATLAFGGASYPLRPDPQGAPHAIHGNGWYSPWRIGDRSESRLVLGLDHRADGDGARDWPFSFFAQQIFELRPDGLTVALTIVNRDDKPMPAGLGLHPYFRRSEGSRFSFRARTVQLSGPDKLPSEEIPVPAAWSFAEARSPAAVELDNCFGGWDGVARLTWPEDGLGLTITASEAFRHLVVYTPAGRDFFCVEPVSHANGAISRVEDAGDHGARVLAAGDSFRGELRFDLDQRP